jgi:hypothetical protein
MSQKFMERFVSMLSNLLLFGLFALGAIELSFSLMDATLYYVYLAIFGASLIFAIKLWTGLKDFENKLALFLPRSSPGPLEDLAPQNFEPIIDDPLEICRAYASGLSMNAIRSSLGLKSDEEVKRSIIKGLRLLLAQHQEADPQ